MKTIIGLALILIGICLGLWLSIYIMLYGGIMQAISNWGMDNSKVVWGIIRAVFFEAGFIPGWLLIALGWAGFIK